MADALKLLVNARTWTIDAPPDATGVRVRRYPLTPSRVLAALERVQVL
jgi:hypothetical protein